MIKPTVGRVVWFWPSANYASQRGMMCSDRAQPLAALIAYVHGDRMVNLSVLDQKGEAFAVCSVPLLQEGDELSPCSFYCEWMPYQKGQAAKTDALTELVSSIAEAKQPLPEQAPAGPALTMADIDAVIVDESYQVLNGSLVTTCCLTLRNGTKVVGINYGSVSASNYCPEKGRQYAREHAIEQVWPLEGYLLRQRLYEQDQDAELMLIAELDAGTTAAEALVDHLQAMGSPVRATIPVKRGDREYQITVSPK